ncbi:hypothetical protein WJX82_003498 [Trebouxia sp. C0006]
MPTAKRLDEQAEKSLSANYLAPGSNPPTGELPGTSDQGSERPPPRRTREQAAAGSRRLRSGATIAEPDEEDQLMSLDASGKPVVAARPASAKPGSSVPSKIKTSSSTSHSLPGSKPKGSASGNRSTAGSQRPGSAKPSKGRLAPLSIPSGQDQADSPRPPSGLAQSPKSALLPASVRSADLSAPAEGTDKAEEDEQGPSTSSKPNLSPVLKSTRGPAPAKVGSPRSPRQPASPSERKTRAGAESRRALEEAAAVAEKTAAEDAIIEHAQIIYERRNTKQLPSFPEPKRGKAHWDHVLEEMNWMAKEFSKERRWKIAQAKRFAKLVSKSNLDVEGRERLRRREELLNLKKRAAWIAKEAMQFWRKAERVVQYKQQMVSNARKKEVMDKHLDFLVGQTQRYSTLLAQRLAGTEEQTGLEALPAPTDGNAPATAAAASDAAASESGVDVAATSPMPATVALLASEISDAEDEEGSPARGDDSSIEYAADLNESPDDDEATLEEEEVLSKAEGGTKNELHSLEAEADMPLEQLLAQYGYVVGGGQGTGSESQSESEFDSAAGSDAGVDDEQTLEEEERMAEAEGAAQHASELEDLEDEANMPLEQLMAKYGYTGSTDVATPSHPSSSPPVKLRSDAPPTPAGPSTDPSPPSLAPHASPHGPAKPAGPSSPSSPATARGRGRAVTSKAQVAGEVAAAAPLAASLLPSSNGTASALPAAPLLPSTGPAEGRSLAPPLLGTSGKAQLADRLTGNIEGAVVPPAALDKGSKRQKDAIERAAEGKAHLEGVAKLANELQPTGSTLSTMQVHTKVPFLLKHGLREYQHIGLDWLMTIYTRRLNGILADEMGLGKTIMTIALLAHLACEKGDWGPHLIVVPTSVMLNWEMEFKKWCPAFKLLTYFGSAKERKIKRHGWSKPNAFHICITSYTLVLQDAKMFRRKKWKYLILDEAHMIKNWKSQRWQTLLNFNSKRRLLITGTPLQNDLMELWSLMHFLMPQIFASHAQFKDWFNNPLVGMVEGQHEVNKGIVERLHSVLRPFLLRRLKCDVEKQLPQKKEHVIRCRLSKRQRTLYEDYMASSDTSATLASSNFLGIINVLMQLRKVCNHPDLFEGRPIVSSFDMWGLPFHMPSLALHALSPSQWGHINLGSINADVAAQEADYVWAAQRRQSLAAPSELIEGQLADPTEYIPETDETLLDSLGFPPSRQAMAVVQVFVQAQAAQQQQWALSRLQHAAVLTARRCAAAPLYGQDMRKAVTVEHPVAQVHLIAARPSRYMDFSDSIAAAIKTAAQRAESLEDTMKQFLFVIPQARSPPPTAWCSHPDQSVVLEAARQAQHAQQEWFRSSASLRTAVVRRQLFFPDRRLLQFDCGKLQELAQLLYQLKSGGHKALIFTQMTKTLFMYKSELAQLLYQLKSGGHKALIFTQMTKMLDVLEAFLNLHGYTYLRLDGTTKPEQRQILMQRFNSNPKIFVFILSTRSGGVGMNLTGADTVIFYDSDWNPAMDAQAQDRCHRIGQTREVHIYRLVSEKTIEENILTKSDQKRQLDHLAIQSGGFNTEFLQKFNPKELLGVQSGGATNTAAATATAATSGGGLSAEEMQAAMRSVEDETDAAAAAALEQENAAELAEFTMEPAARAAGEVAGAEAGDEAEEEDVDADDIKEPSDSRPREASIPISTSAAADPDRPSPPSEPGPSTALVPLAGADEDEMMEDVAQMAGGGQVSGQDALTNLETTLRPVEKYAVRFLEEMQRQTAAESAAAEAEQLEMQEQEWNMAELERIQEQQEADMDEEGDAERAAQWDLAAADAAYKAQVEAALAQQRAVEEEQRLLMEQLEEQAAAAAAARAEEEERLAARPQRKAAPRPVRSRAASPSSDSEEFESPVARYRGSRWAGKRELDEDRPLGRGMRFKQEPAYIQDSTFASGLDPLSPVANKRRRTQFTSTGPSRFARTGRSSDPRQTPSEEAVQEGGNARTPARPARRLPRHIFSHGPAALTARGAPVQIWQPWEAAEDLVLCAMVQSAITAALGLPLDALPGSHPTAPRPSPPTFNSNPQQPAMAPSQRPQPMATAQAARPPSYMTTATVTAFGAGGGINTAPRLAGQQASSGAGGTRTAAVGEDVWQLASDVMAAGGTATTAAAVTTAAQQAKKRSASDCRARFLMLVRARQAALAPQIYHRLPPTPSPAAARPSALAAAIAPSVPGPAGPLLTAAATVPFHPSATAAPQPMAVAAHMQHPPTASLQIASALAGQPSHPVLQPPSSTAAADTTAVPGRGRGVQLGHKASLDVLRVKLRLVDLVQGSAALQPKELRQAFSQAIAAAAAETQAAAASKPPSPSQALPGGAPQNPQRPGIFSSHASSSGVSGPFAIPSVVSGAEKAVKDLEQLAAADPEALIDSIEELLPAGTSQEAGVAGGSSAGLVTGVTGLADPVLSKGNGSLTQEEGGSGAVEVGLQEALDILTAATKGCGSYAKPILRHITTVAEFAKRDGVQAANEALLKLLQPGLAALGNQLMDQSRTGGSLTQQMPVMALPASLVLSGVPVGSSQPAVSSAPAVCEGHRNA